MINQKLQKKKAMTTACMLMPACNNLYQAVESNYQKLQSILAIQYFSRAGVAQVG